jgi:hypothetical protein
MEADKTFLTSLSIAKRGEFIQNHSLKNIIFILF